MTKTQKILLVVAGGVGFLLLASRSQSASAAGSSTGTSYTPVPGGGGGGGHVEEVAEIPVQAPPASTPSLTIFFASGSTTVSEADKERIKTGPTAWRAAELHGYASSLGSASSNLVLTRQRNDAVAVALRQKFPAIVVEAYAHGEQGATSDTASRRVDVWLSR
jgi:outer membrane protein OmpA-like peptidoglycan-associated protein